MTTNRNRSDRSRTPRLAAVGGALLMSALLTAPLGCATEHREGDDSVVAATAPLGMWSPYARPSFVTIDRSTTYAIVRDERRDMLIVRQQTGDDDLEWLVTLPPDAPFNRPLDLPQGEAQVWVVERFAGGSTRVQEGSGRVAVIGRTPDLMSAQLDLSAPGSPMGPGQLARRTLMLSARLDLPRHEPYVPAMTEPERRGGEDSTPAPPSKEKKD